MHLGLAGGGNVVFLLSDLVVARRAAAVLLLVLYRAATGLLLGCAFTGVVEVSVFVIVGEGIIVVVDGGVLCCFRRR